MENTFHDTNNNTNSYFPEIAADLNNTAKALIAEEKYEEALASFKKAEILYRHASKNNLEHLSDYVTVLSNMGFLHQAMDEYDEAFEKYEKVLSIRNSLTPEEKSLVHLPDTEKIMNALTAMSYSLNEQASHHRMKGEIDEGLEKAQKALSMCRLLVSNNPKPYLIFLATLLNDLAILHTAKAEHHEEALSEFNEALTIFRSQAKENPQDHLPSVAACLIGLSAFYINAVPDKTQSIMYAKEGIEIMNDFPALSTLDPYRECATQILQEHQKQ
ncbi:tetratricopeptide (TPR) repeat protein [Parabacteroides sp. PF5-5]|uniref:tetratricopeptide repeat protein n=1 Tax=unclassified Parabacteroides TaxID=2649774 RepID=UPI0024762221|nr:MULTISPECIES: tetratricopeptide repeat protein [unclassified Parabacteroides]MDH6306437.1 tetratricopeptide (TPR) repeat protein [Parabacteroides sp. PH5-39]MDH6317411.1 tetratricopeptide (TPR) repeat protein [Parabacteroides sp. PF5-13]MDH6321148.1 tetratricopeptide (TPR) repeat protein [Parabacteroides sp. PH5-13]MDH6324880.1 tetratricopeptide (TPR) repeat protein [Parabacteroides sp. PH5-8]MDH6328596.1 tetratricopeptide (TPR) repeat protein [Parabacteroides sp. PH5-41]